MADEPRDIIGWRVRPRTKSQDLKDLRACVGEKMEGVEAPDEVPNHVDMDLPAYRALFLREKLAEASRECSREMENGTE